MTIRKVAFTRGQHVFVAGQVPGKGFIATEAVVVQDTKPNKKTVKVVPPAVWDRTAGDLVQLSPLVIAFPVTAVRINANDDLVARATELRGKMQEALDEYRRLEGEIAALFQEPGTAEAPAPPAPEGEAAEEGAAEEGAAEEGAAEEGAAEEAAAGDGSTPRKRRRGKEAAA